MEVAPQQLLEYLTPRGENPFREWLHSLRSDTTRAIIRVRLNRIRLGNFGDCTPLGDGVCELRIHDGPGYRIYYGRAGTTIVVLLCGGEKGSQKGDIRRSKAFWLDYQERTS